MNIALDLSESYQRLVELEKVLDAHRNALVHHEATKNVKECSSSMHYQYVSLVDKYNGCADTYHKEVQRFKSLLAHSVRLQQEVVNAQYQAYTASIASSPSPAPSASVSTEQRNDDNANNHHAVSNEEITRNYLESTALSVPATESATMKYASSCDGLVDEITEHNEDAAASVHVSPRKTATANTWTTRGGDEQDEQDERKSVATTSSSSTGTASRSHWNPSNRNTKSSKPGIVRTTAKLRPLQTSIVARNNHISYKYAGKGFEVWNRNGRRPIYQATSLRVNQSFGADDQAGKRRLKQFLVKQAGLRAEVMENMQVLDDHALVSVRDSARNIERAVDKLNAGRPRGVASIRYSYQYVNANKGVNRKLFVTGFDILSANDHRRMSELFLRFGDLASDVFMNKDKNGNPYAMVTFKEERCAKMCVQSQSQRGSHKMDFNGKQLIIRYCSEEKGNNKGSSNKKNGNKGRRFKQSN